MKKKKKRSFPRKILQARKKLPPPLCIAALITQGRGERGVCVLGGGVTYKSPNDVLLAPGMGGQRTGRLGGWWWRWGVGVGGT